MRAGAVAIVIPALDEAASIGGVVRSLLAARPGACVLVSDNGSRDETPRLAREAGAIVVSEPVRGYGRACLRALRELETIGAQVELVAFADGDGADDPADLAALLAPLDEGRADLVIGSRVLGERAGLVERGALTRAQRAGNALAAALLEGGYGVRATDLGPFRAITRAGLARLRMDDVDFGWTVQMQARAARAGLRTVEVPVRYRRRRTGRSKVSGDVRASLQAGRVILTTLWRERRFVA
jgi:glycosyltransferase involved in cell wall biosynthesis